MWFSSHTYLSTENSGAMEQQIALLPCARRYGPVFGDGITNMRINIMQPFYYGISCS